MTLSFCPQLAEMYRSRRTTGRSGRVFDNLGPLTTPNNLHVLRALMLERRPEHTLEVGLSFGGSALAIAASHRDLRHAPHRQHVAIDPFQSTVWDDAGRVAIETADLAGYVEVREAASCAALPRLIDERRKFDLIYIDGSHLFEDVFVDLYFAVHLLSDTGIVLFDDCTDRHVAKVLRFVTTNWAASVAEVDLARYREDGGSLRYKIARSLGKTQLRAFRRIGPPREWNSTFHDF